MQPEPIVLFDCASDAHRVRLLGRYGGELVLESWDAKFPSITVEDTMWADVRSGRVIGQQGGHQSHVRLNGRGTQYILFEGQDGQLADDPGRAYAGVLKFEGQSADEPVSEIACSATDLNRNVADEVRDYRRKNGKPVPAEEDPDGPFDAWF